jgi:hypothetical protein
MKKQQLGAYTLTETIFLLFLCFRCPLFYRTSGRPRHRQLGLALVPSFGFPKTKTGIIRSTGCQDHILCVPKSKAQLPELGCSVAPTFIILLPPFGNNHTIHILKQHQLQVTILFFLGSDHKSINWPEDVQFTQQDKTKQNKKI